MPLPRRIMGSFYRAARVLEIEQSTLSRAILKLERSIGMPIFQRSRAGVTMTLAGNAFIRGRKADGSHGGQPRGDDACGRPGPRRRIDARAQQLRLRRQSPGDVD
jgi:hypothetical protein